MVSIHPFWGWRGPLSVSADVGGGTWERVAPRDGRFCCPRSPGESSHCGCGDIGEVADVTQPIQDRVGMTGAETLACHTQRLPRGAVFAGGGRPSG